MLRSPQLEPLSPWPANLNRLCKADGDARVPIGTFRLVSQVRNGLLVSLHAFFLSHQY